MEYFFGLRKKTLKRRPVKRKPVKRRKLKRKPVKRRKLKRKPVKRRKVKRKPVKRRKLKRKSVKRRKVKRKPVKRRKVKRKPVKRKPVKRRTIYSQASYSQPVYTQPVIQPQLVKPDTCSEELIRLYRDLESELYDYENRHKFKKKVKALEKAVKNAKKEAGVKVTEKLTDENRTRRLELMSKQLPDKPCIMEKSSIQINVSGENLTINESETSSPEYFKDIFDRCKNVLKHNRIIIPVGIRNFKNGEDSAHSNIIIVDLDTKEAWRIEPNKVDEKNIKRYARKLKKFFLSLGIEFKGFYPETCPISHGGLCKYVTYAQYLYGKELSYNNVKNVILQFLKDDILDLCKI